MGVEIRRVHVINQINSVTVIPTDHHLQISFRFRPFTALNLWKLQHYFLLLYKCAIPRVVQKRENLSTQTERCLNLSQLQISAVCEHIRRNRMSLLIPLFSRQVTENAICTFLTQAGLLRHMEVSKNLLLKPANHIPTTFQLLK